MPVNLALLEQRTWHRTAASIMGTTAELMFDGPASLTPQAFERLRELERAWSRFLPDSELNRLHARPDEWVRVSHDLFVALRWCARLHDETDGRFDPSIRTALERWGYDCTFRDIDPREPAPAYCDPAPGLAGLELRADGKPLACYAKMHPVMFGEYVPLAERFPFLYRLTPLAAGLTAGREPVAVTIAGTRVAVNICYETALPEAVRTLVLELGRQGGRPDVIVNLTNDGWFWGSSELDMHLTAAIFRAVEVRTPLVIAANTGFSASIDGAGRLLARGPRRATGTLRVRVRPDGRTSPWLAWGSLPLAACVAIAAVALLSRIIGMQGDHQTCRSAQHERSGQNEHHVHRAYSVLAFK
jgi:hypothetical protein